MQVPKLGDQLPQRGNRFSRWFGRNLMHLLRWRAEGEICLAPRFVFVMAPHTSWWDFSVNFAVLQALGLRASWFIANKYAKGGVAKVLIYFGAVPVERGERADLVSQMVTQFIVRDKFVLAIFPEGTRKPVSKWKTGFWHIAKKAGVPVQLVAVDYARRATIFGPVVYLSEDMEKDMKYMQAYFKDVCARRPENSIFIE